MATTKDNVHPFYLDLIGDSDVFYLRTKAWKFEGVLRDFYKYSEAPSKGPFSVHVTPSLFASGESVCWMFHVVNGGLTLKPYEHLEKNLAKKTAKVVDRNDYDSIQNLCNNFTNKVLHRMYSIGQHDRLVGNLDDAFLLVGDMGGPEEASFKSDYCFYLRPANVLNFLCGSNTSGGLMELYFRYNLSRYDEKKPIFQELMLHYNSKEKVLEVQDVGFYQKMDGRLKGIMKPSLDRKTPLEKLVTGDVSKPDTYGLPMDNWQRISVVYP